MTKEPLPLLLCIVISWLLVASSRGQEQKPTGLVRVVDSDKTVIVGTIGRRNDTHIEVFDLKTLQPTIFKVSDLLSIKEQVSDSSAISAVGMPNFLAWKIKQSMPHGSGIGRIARVDGTTIYVTIGSDHRIEAGRELLAYRGEEPVKDPASGKILGEQRRQVARLEIVKIAGAKLSTAKVVGKAEPGVEVGDVVETAPLKDATVLLPLVDVQGNELEEGKNLIEEWTTTLVSRGVPVVDRKHLDAVLNELKLQQTKEFDAEKAQKVGKQIGAATVLTGTVVAKSGYGTAQLRLIRVDTGEIVLALRYNMGRVALRPKEARSGRGNPSGKIKKYFFATEKDIRENWEIERDWRIEGNALKVDTDAVLRSKRKYKGDFQMEILCSAQNNYAVKVGPPSVTVGMWGESFTVPLADSPSTRGIVRLMRKGSRSRGDL